MEKRMMRGLIFSVLSAISLIGSDVQDLQSLKSGATPACCSKLVTGQVWQDGMAVPTTSTGSMSQTGTLTWSGGTTTQGTGGTAVSGASNYYSDANSISGVGLYGATSGSGTWTVPAGVTKLQVVIVGGGAPAQYYYGGGSGYVIAKTAYVTEGTQITWSVGGPATQSCFNGWCAAGGSGKNGGSGGGAGIEVSYGGRGSKTGANGTGYGYGSGGLTYTLAEGGGGGGGGYGGAGGAGNNGGGGGGTNGGGGVNTSGAYRTAGTGQGSYSTVVTSPLTVTLLSTGASALLPFSQNGAIFVWTQ